MVLLGIGSPIMLLGLTMMVRGWVYTLRPDGGMAKKRQKVNLKRGFTTDMKVFGRKVRRLGLMLTLAGATMVGWHFSQGDDGVDAPSETPTETPVGPLPG
jgi:hypothetical protein